MKSASLIVLKMVIKNVSSYAVTALTSVPYAQDLTPEGLSMDKSYTHCVLKFVEHVQKSVLNTHLITKAAKNVRKRAKNAQKFVHNLLQ